MFMTEEFSEEHCPCWQSLFSSQLCDVCIRKIRKATFPRSVSFKIDANLKLRAMTSYTDYMKEYIYLCKSAPFNGLMPTQKNMLKELCAYWAEELKAAEIDALVAIPSHPFRSLLQSDLAWFLARYLSRALKKTEPLPLMKRRFFIRGQTYSSQKHLRKIERQEFIREQYYVPHRSKYQKLRVLLVDDVCTTGSTLKLCRDLLERAEHQVHSAIVLSKVGS